MATSLPDDPASDDAASRLRDLCGRLIAGPSATAVLERWCRERGAPQSLVAHALPVEARMPSPAQRERLKLTNHDLVRYRRVRLTCGGRVLSEAENWYVPTRLTPAMNTRLDSSAVPFGRVVEALVPTRRNLGLRPLTGADHPATAAAQEPLFAIEALLLRQDGLPLCEVAEVYLGVVLALD